MSSKKLSSVKFANSVKVGAKEVTFAQSSDYSLELENMVLIKIKGKRDKEVTYTSIFNTIWFKEEESKNADEKIKDDQVESSKNSTRAKKAIIK